MKKLYILALSVLAAACAMTYVPKYYFNEIQVVNLTGTTITNVNLRINNSVKTLSCDEVANNALCQDRFGKRRYPQQGIELSWTHGDGVGKSQQFNPGIPSYYHTAFPLRVMLEINEEGAVKHFFEQEEPGGAFFDF